MVIPDQSGGDLGLGRHGVDDVKWHLDGEGRIRVDTTHRERWLAARQFRGLDPATAGFGETGLLAMLGEPGVFVTILPADPLRPALDFSDEQLTAQVLPERLVGQTAYGVSSLNQITSTADALVRYYVGGESAWRAFSAIRRDGGAEVGFDAYVTRYEQGALASPTGSVIYRLFVLVHAVRMAIDTQARLVQLLPTLGFEADEFAPYELDVVMPGAGGGILGGFTDGWGSLVASPTFASALNGTLLCGWRWRTGRSTRAGGRSCSKQRLTGSATRSVTAWGVTLPVKARR